MGIFICIVFKERLIHSAIINKHHISHHGHTEHCLENLTNMELKQIKKFYRRGMQE